SSESRSVVIHQRPHQDTADIGLIQGAPMPSTLNPEQDPHDVIEIAPDVVLAARTDKPSLTPATGAPSEPSAPEVRVVPAPDVATPSVETTFRATTLDDIPISGER